MLERFYGCEKEFREIQEKLKRTACPDCKAVGHLILHGFLKGYDEGDRRQKCVRARRIFCNDRKARGGGCGRTFSVWVEDKVRRSKLTAGCLWKFLNLVVTGGNQLRAIRAIACGLTDSAVYRIWQRFARVQTHVRTALANLCPPPAVEDERPAAQTIAHLKAAFPGAKCPIISYQRTLQSFFLEPAGDAAG